MMKPTEEQAKAIREVLNGLEKYEGETVVAHKHTLHHAVVALEKLCVLRPSEKQNVLFRPAKIRWLCLLWASRPNNTTYLELFNDQIWIAKWSPSKDANSEVSLHWATKLSNVLRTWLEKIPTESTEWNTL